MQAASQGADEDQACVQGCSTTLSSCACRGVTQSKHFKTTLGLTKQRTHTQPPAQSLMQVEPWAGLRTRSLMAGGLKQEASAGMDLAGRTASAPPVPLSSASMLTPATCQPQLLVTTGI